LVEDFNVEKLEDFIATVSKDVVFVVGPGWDTQKSEEKLNIIRKLLLVPNTMIIDADGLNVLSQNIELVKGKNPSNQ